MLMGAWLAKLLIDISCLLGSQQQTRHSSIRQLKDGMVDIA